MAPTPRESAPTWRWLAAGSLGLLQLLGVLLLNSLSQDIREIRAQILVVTQQTAMVSMFQDRLNKQDAKIDALADDCRVYGKNPGSLR